MTHSIKAVCFTLSVVEDMYERYFAIDVGRFLLKGLAIVWL